MHGMHGVVLGTKQLVVRLHEPKQLRQEKLAQRFGGHNGHPRSSSGASSPTLASEAGDGYGGWPSSPTMRGNVLGSPIMGAVGGVGGYGEHRHGGHGHGERVDRARRSSGSYYHVGFFLFSFAEFFVKKYGWRTILIGHFTSMCLFL